MPKLNFKIRVGDIATKSYHNISKKFAIMICLSIKKIKIIGDCSLHMAVFISAKKMKGISFFYLL